MKYDEFITFFGTNNLELTSEFYQNILGLTLYKDQKVCLIFNVTEQSKIGFCEHIPVLNDEKSPIITLVTEEVDEVYKKLVKSGLEISEGPKLNPKFDIYHFFFKDPNDYTIEVQRFLK
jgi:predicted enzyme related to lactoylglutathione lyase